MAYFIDTSALVKLVIEEKESSVLREWLTPDRVPVTCDLARAELFRVVRRVDVGRARQASRLLDSIGVMELRRSIFEAAGRLEPISLRTLDAVHVAAALDLGGDLEGMITYDTRIAEAAALNGISVFAPGL